MVLEQKEREGWDGCICAVLIACNNSLLSFFGCVTANRTSQSYFLSILARILK